MAYTKEQARAYYAANKGQFAEYRRRYKEREALRKLNPDLKIPRNMKNGLHSRAGAPPPSGCCDICGANNRKIVYDHCHKTGRFRGWICHQCNVALGMAEDSPERLRQLIDYLEK